MKFLLDESSEHRLAAFLQEHGHDVKSIAHDYPNALSDTEVLELAGREARIVITNDKDLGELISNADALTMASSCSAFPTVTLRTSWRPSESRCYRMPMILAIS